MRRCGGQGDSNSLLNAAIISQSTTHPHPQRPPPPPLQCYMGPDPGGAEGARRFCLSDEHYIASLLAHAQQAPHCDCALLRNDALGCGPGGGPGSWGVGWRLLNHTPPEAPGRPASDCCPAAPLPHPPTHPPTHPCPAPPASPPPPLLCVGRALSRCGAGSRGSHRTPLPSRPLRSTPACSGACAGQGARS